MTSAATVLALMSRTDWPAVRDIYAEGIATGHATFETEPPSWETFDRTRSPDHRFVAARSNDRDEVLGWVSARAVSDRCVYTGVVEHSVFVANRARRQGVGQLLLEGLIESTEAAGIWTIQSGIFPENQASLSLHLAVGFRVVGTREALGRMSHGPMAGEWRDVLMLERRSAALPR